MMLEPFEVHSRIESPWKAVSKRRRESHVWYIGACCLDSEARLFLLASKIFQKIVPRPPIC